MIKHIRIPFKLNKLVKYFIVVDLLFFAGWGLIEPIFSIFIVDRVEGATIITVGIAAAVYWFLKSILELPIARYLDHHAGEKDDFYALIAGLFIAALSALSFGLVHTIWQVYVVQAFHALGLALYIASWPAIFSRHLDRDHVSFDWAIDSATVGIAAGVTGLLSGIIAEMFGFPAVFILGAAFSAASALLLLLIPQIILPIHTTSSPAARRDHTPVNIEQ